MAGSRLDPEEKGISSADTLGGAQGMVIVNESCLDNLIFSSRKPDAKQFKRWVIREVLPGRRRILRPWQTTGLQRRATVIAIFNRFLFT